MTFILINDHHINPENITHYVFVQEKDPNKIRTSKSESQLTIYLTTNTILKFSGWDADRGNEKLLAVQDD